MKERGVTVWLTGLSGAGKTTLARELERRLLALGRSVEVLDGDIVRQNLSAELGFGKEDRDTNVRRIAFVAGLLSRNGVIAVTAAISPYRAGRAEARALSTSFLEVHVAASLEACERRDVKGLYARARAGLIGNFTGISDPYEPPVDPDIVCRTDREAIDESAERILDALIQRGHVRVPAVVAEAGVVP